MDAPASPRSAPGPLALVLGAVYGLLIVWLTDERNFYGQNSPGMSAFAVLVFAIILGIVLLAVFAAVTRWRSRRVRSALEAIAFAILGFVACLIIVGALTGAFRTE